MVEKSQFLVMFNFFPWKKPHFRQKSPKMQNLATSWGHRAAKMNPMNIIFSSKLNSNVFLHPQKILGPIDFHRSLHNFFAEKKPISGNVQATLENRLMLFAMSYLPSKIFNLWVCQKSDEKSRFFLTIPKGRGVFLFLRLRL